MALSDVIAAIAALQADVTAQQTVEASTITLLQGLTAQLAAANAALATAVANSNPTAIAAALTDLQALHTTVTAQTASLAAAVTANTPAGGA